MRWQEIEITVDQNKMKLRLLSSFLVLLTGPLYMGDLIFDYFGIVINNTFGFKSSGDFLFYNCQLLTVLILIFISQMKPYKISYISPIYSVLLSTYWIYFYQGYDTKPYFDIYIICASILSLFCLILISFFFEKETQEMIETNEKAKLYEAYFDLNILRIKKYLGK